MKIRGVCYDVGRVLGGQWRPIFDVEIVTRELQIIHRDLHCTAVRICGHDLDRVTNASEIAAAEGLEVWMSPEMWSKRRSATRSYIAEASRRAQKVALAYPGQIILSIGSEFSLYTRGFVPGLVLSSRLGRASDYAHSPRSTSMLRNFLHDVVGDVRREFSGPITYASLTWEEVDWTLFDIIGVDHFRDERIEHQYLDMLTNYFTFDKPVVITEFGMRGYVGANCTGTLGTGIVDDSLLTRSKLPFLKNHVTLQLVGDPVRDEHLQASEVVHTLGLLNAKKVNGAFVTTFSDYLAPTSDDPKFDLDMSSFSLVKNLGTNNGTTYPNMNWEPKESFHAVADWYNQAENQE